MTVLDPRYSDVIIIGGGATGAGIARDCALRGLSVTLLERPHPDYSVATLLALIRDRETRPALLDPVLQLPLPDSWRKLFAHRRAAGEVEDWARRMQGTD